MTLKQLTISLALAIIIFPLASTLSSAQTVTVSPAPVIKNRPGIGRTDGTKVADLQSRAVREISNRIDSLNQVLAIVQKSTRLSTTNKTDLITRVQAEIQVLQTLQTKIKSESDITALREDVQSITKAYRVFWLFIPQIHIISATEKIATSVDSMTSVATKLQTRITEVGSSASGLQSKLDDARAKIAAAQTQGQAALDLVQALQPDNGDQTVLQSNNVALKQARSDIQTANSDLRTALKDFRSIVLGLKQLSSPQASPTPTPTP